MSSRKSQAESQTPQQRIEHLYAVLLAIRNVNQLIIREKDPDALVEQACDLLVETRGYYSAWIALLDGEGTVRTVAESGLGEAFQPLVEQLQRGEFTACARRALAEPGVRVIQDPLVECADCPLSHAYEGRSGMTVRLAHGGRTYGLMSVSIPAKYAQDDEEAELFREVAGDIAYAVHGMAVEDQRNRAAEALRESNEYLDSLFNYANAPIIVWDPQFRITRFNHAFEHLAGRTAIGVVGQPLEILFPPASEDSSMMLIRETLSGERWESVEVPILKSDGSVRTVLWNSATIFAPDGKTLVATIAQGQDITERKRSERENAERQKELECLYEVARAAQEKEQGLDTFLRSVTAALPPALQYPAVASARLVLDGQEYLSHGYREGRWKQSAAIRVGREECGYVEVTYSEPTPEEYEGPFLLQERKLLDAVAVRVGITVERVRAEEKLQVTGEQMRRLAQRVEEVREEERASLARELHDTAGQAITALKLDVSRIMKRLEQGQAPTPKELGALNGLLDRTADEVRHISSELRPGVLDDIGLDGAIEWQIDELKKRTDLVFIVCPTSEESQLDYARRTALFRIFQELLTNVVRHAGARSVRIVRGRVGDVYTLTIADDGSGVDLEKLEDSSSIGIIGMRERLRPYGGELRYDSAPGKGTTARVVMPVE